MTSSGSTPVDATPDEAIQYAVSALRAGKLAVAENVFGQVLDAFPDYPDALHYLGLLRVQQGKRDEGVALVERSLVLNPNNAGALNNLANLQLHDSPELARLTYLRCLKLAPDMPDALTNIGSMLREEGAIDEAEAIYRRALSIRPDFPEALNNLGSILTARGNHAEAIEVLQRCIALEPRFGGAYANLASAYFSQGNDVAATDASWKAIALRHGDKVARKLLIHTLTRCGEYEKAAEVAREWLELTPDDPDARHHHAAATGENVPTRASDAYISTMFDRFSTSFDAALARLDYRAPDLCVAMLARHVPVPGADLAILDAGCGTGLCGPLLRPYASDLVGIDLSAGMLTKAEARNVYDRLEHAELTAALQASQATYDVIVSADTLCYFGDLHDVLKAATAALRPKGRLIFTVELLPDDAIDFAILPASGRYAHGRGYVAVAIISAGLTNVVIEDQDLRLEGGAAVRGLVVFAERA